MKRVYSITTNAVRLMAAIDALGKRGAREACWVAATGPAGLGKTTLLKWWALENNAVYLRAKTNWTPRSALSELMAELSTTPPARLLDALVGQAYALLARDPRPIIIDEVEHALRDITILETFRDLSDLTECPVIIAGMESVRQRVQRHEQISSRITQVVDFLPASAADVERMACDLLPRVQLAADLIAKILEESEGRYRLIMDALAEIERHAERNGMAVVTAADFPKRLTHDWRLRIRASKSTAGTEGA